MRRRGIRAVQPRDGVRPQRVRALDALVRTVAALDGPAATALLQGLSEAHRSVALGILSELHRSGRAERHAGLISLFAARPAPHLAAGVPGRLGAELRILLAGGGTPRSNAGREPMSRWAARLVKELGD
jgi:hypothetical protein